METSVQKNLPIVQQETNRANEQRLKNLEKARKALQQKNTFKAFLQTMKEEGVGVEGDTAKRQRVDDIDLIEVSRDEIRDMKRARRDGENIQRVAESESKFTVGNALLRVAGSFVGALIMSYSIRLVTDYINNIKNNNSKTDNPQFFVGANYDDSLFNGQSILK
jgi:hypothetical protein